MSENRKIEIDNAVIISQEKIAAGIYSMWLDTTTAKSAKAGQFISIYTNEGSRILPRPISICEIGEDRKSLRVVYRVVGKGTAEFSQMNKGESLKVIGPLGNGYTLKDKTAILAAGGIGN